MWCGAQQRNGTMGCDGQPLRALSLEPFRPRLVPLGLRAGNDREHSSNQPLGLYDWQGWVRCYTSAGKVASSTEEVLVVRPNRGSERECESNVILVPLRIRSRYGLLRLSQPIVTASRSVSLEPANRRSYTSSRRRWERNAARATSAYLISGWARISRCRSSGTAKVTLGIGLHMIPINEWLSVSLIPPGRRHFAVRAVHVFGRAVAG